MTCAKKDANAIGGKTARACDSCISKRARWYCAADDAFLCQGCDSSVHSANLLARRHKRVRLKMASCKSSDSAKRELNNYAPSWHKGFTKKPRTPRHGKHSPYKARNPFHLVPEVGSDDTNSHEECGEQLLYRVPTFEPFVAELCTTPSSVTSPFVVETKSTNGIESKDLLGCNNHGVKEGLHGFLPSDIEVAEFAADVESLLGKGLENECVGMEELGLVDSKEEGSSWECCVGDGNVKIEEEEKPEEVDADADAGACKVDEDQMEMGRESFELSFDYDDDESPAVCEDVEEKVALDVTKDVESGEEVKENCQAKRKTLLQLDYEAVITAWASQKSPWTTGDKPDLDPDQCWRHCMVF